MTTSPLNSTEERSAGFNWLFKIPYTDLTGTAGLTKTVTLLSGLGVGHIVQNAAFYLRTAYDGGATTNLALDVGYDLAAGTDDPDAILDNYEIHVDATEILAGDANGVIFATLRTGYAFQESASITALFTAVGANLTALTQGEVWIFLRVADLTKLGGL